MCRQYTALPAVRYASGILGAFRSGLHVQILAAATVLRVILRDPLTHFILAGIALYALAYAFRGPAAVDPLSRRVVVSPQQIDALANRFSRSTGAKPDRATLENLVEYHVREEIAYREAQILGLDRDDAIVRRRMQQKLDFLLQDMDASREPTDAELRAYLDANADAYRQPERISFRQVHVAGADRARRAGEIKVRLQNGAAPDRIGDAGLLPAAMTLATPAAIARTFGDRFVEPLLAAPQGEWSGPIESAFGLHVLFVSEYRAPQIPGFAELREELRAALLRQRQNDALDAAYRKLIAEYDVRIDWPDAYRDSETP